MITLPELPFAKDALAPVISANTLEFHYGKHHKAYVDNLGKLIAGTDLANSDLETIIKKAAGDSAKTGIFNNAAQVWNHSFYWKCLKAGGGGAPTGAVAAKITAAWGSYRKIRGGAEERRSDPVRKRLGVACPRGRSAEDRQDRKRRHPHRSRPETAPHP